MKSLVVNFLCGVFCLISSRLLCLQLFAESDGLHTTDHFKDIHPKRSALYTVHVALSECMERPDEQPH